MHTKILGPESDIRVCKVLVTASFADVKVEHDKKFTLGKDNKTKEFLAVSPMGRVPVIETPTVVLFESNTAMRHLARMSPSSFLYGEDTGFSGASEVDQWLDFVSLEIEVPSCVALCETSQCITVEMKKRAISDILEAVKSLATHFNKFTYLGRHRVSIADISLAVSIKTLVDNDLFKISELPAPIVRWFETISHLPKFSKVMPLSSKSKVDSKTCESTEAEDEKKPEKKVDPLDLLPPTTMDLNEWKRVYSNTTDFRGVALPWLWKNFDASGYCFWWMKYDKLEGECTIPFVTSNQLGGFLQRTDPAFRKYSFAVINIVGDNGCYDIQGVWMFRGKEIPFQMKDHPSYEYHTWRSLDHAKAEDKKLIEDYFAEAEKVEGLKISDCKVWK